MGLLRKHKKKEEMSDEKRRHNILSKRVGRKNRQIVIGSNHAKVHAERQQLMGGFQVGRVVTWSVRGAYIPVKIVRSNRNKVKVRLLSDVGDWKSGIQKWVVFGDLQVI